MTRHRALSAWWVDNLTAIRLRTSNLQRPPQPVNIREFVKIPLSAQRLIDPGEGACFITQPEEANFREDSLWESYKPGSLE